MQATPVFYGDLVAIHADLASTAPLTPGGGIVKPVDVLVDLVAGPNL